MIRDRLVCGINNPRMQRRLLQEPDLTYDKAFKKAQSMKVAAQDVANMTTETKQSPVNIIRHKGGFSKHDDHTTSNVLDKHTEAFRPQLRKLCEITAMLYVKSDAHPRFVRPHSVTHSLKEKVAKELDRFQELGVITPVTHSEWAAPIVPILKGDGLIRLCGNYEVTVNPVLLIDSYPLPRIEDLFASLSGGSIFKAGPQTCGDSAEHLYNLHLVLQRLESAGLTLKKSKCTFEVSFVEYLGPIIDTNGLHPSEAKFRAMRDAP
uniref:Reverse transcriptase domain-containing protein n=1 Tax=Amphimedon queenslandica TaxID=400682 RepID=A0A1X7V3C5_AMPQE